MNFALYTGNSFIKIFLSFLNYSEPIIFMFFHIAALWKILLNYKKFINIISTI